MWLEVGIAGFMSDFFYENMFGKQELKFFMRQVSALSAVPLCDEHADQQHERCYAIQRHELVADLDTGVQALYTADDFFHPHELLSDLVVHKSAAVFHLMEKATDHSLKRVRAFVVRQCCGNSPLGADTCLSPAADQPDAASVRPEHSARGRPEVRHARVPASADEDRSGL